MFVNYRRPYHCIHVLRCLFSNTWFRLLLFVIRLKFTFSTLTLLQVFGVRKGIRPVLISHPQSCRFYIWIYCQLQCYLLVSLKFRVLLAPIWVVGGVRKGIRHCSSCTRNVTFWTCAYIPQVHHSVRMPAFLAQFLGGTHSVVSDIVDSSSLDIFKNRLP